VAHCAAQFPLAQEDAERAAVYHMHAVAAACENPCQFVGHHCLLLQLIDFCHWPLQGPHTQSSKDSLALVGDQPKHARSLTMCRLWLLFDVR